MITAKSMRSVLWMTSVPHGDCGAKITICMSEETELYDILSAAWDAAKDGAPNPLLAEIDRLNQEVLG